MSLNAKSTSRTLHSDDAQALERAHLRGRAREVILSGKLPAKMPYRAWGGPSLGGVCAVCDRKVLPRDLEYEVEFDDNDGLVTGRTLFHLHITCFLAWEYQRQLLR